VSVSIILQNLAQLKKLFEKEWESIVGNCDEFVYLGGNEQATHKYVSELLGKETIYLNTFNRTTGSKGSYTKNDNINGREIMTPDEVRLLDNRNAILFIRGERPVLDLKYDIMKHPNVELTADGKGEPYVHGDTSDAVGSVEVMGMGVMSDEGEEDTPVEGRFELLTEEEIEKEIKRMEGEKKNDKAE
nr:TraM recognition domain-containing protein [Clostridia bacterium]